MDNCRLPIPPLEDTMKRYVDALEGLQVSAGTMHAGFAGKLTPEISLSFPASAPSPSSIPRIALTLDSYT